MRERRPAPPAAPRAATGRSRGAAPARPYPRAVRRDRLTLTFYGCFVTWGWLLYSFNPSVSLLADEFGITAAQAGLHGTAMAAGAVVAAGLTPRLVARRGRRAALQVSLALVALGVLALVLAPSLAVSLPAMLVLSLGGNVAISSAQPGLALHHGPAASAAVTEANGVGSSVGLVGPLAVGASVAIGWGWRPAVAVTVLLAGATWWFTSRIRPGGAMTPAATPGTAAEAPTTSPAVPYEHPTAPDGVAPVLGSVEALAVAVVEPHHPPVRHRTSPAGGFFLVAVIAAIALENATTYWSTDLVREQTGAGAGIATATTAGLLAGMSAVRFLVGPLSLRVRPALLLAGSFVVAILGWAVLWTASTPAVAVVGLVVAGFGYGAQYPLSIALLLATAPDAQDVAQSRATLAGGLAIGVAPFLLGALADAFGMHDAFLVVPVAAALGGVAALAGGRAARVR